MNELENSFQKTFTIYPKHLNYLESVNENTSFALRNVLDNIIKKQKNNIKTRVFKDLALYVVIFALGMVFFLFTIKSTSYIEMYLSCILSMFFTCFSIIGGAVVALQSIRNKK